jgi:hypothetical protein
VIRSRRKPVLRTFAFSFALATFLFGSQYCFASLLLGAGMGLPVMPCHGTNATAKAVPPCHGSSEHGTTPAQAAPDAPCCIQLTAATESTVLPSAADGLSFVLPVGLTASDPAPASPVRFAAFSSESPPGHSPGAHRGRAPPLS